MASLRIIMETQVAPTIGAILSSLAFSAPIKSLRAAVKVGNLGSLNPTPWAFMLGNTVGWLAYSFITGDLYVFFANVFGLLFSIYLNIGAMKLQYYDIVRKKTPSIQLAVANASDTDIQQDDNDCTDIADDRDGSRNEAEQRNNESTENLQSFTSHEIKVLTVIVTWVLILSTTSLASKNQNQMERIIGISVNINLMLFYGAPLSTISTVIKSKSSSSIHFWTMVMNTTNTFFWCVYSFAIEDYYILIPNGTGFSFGMIQVLLYCLFPHNQTDVAEGTEQFLNGERVLDPEIESEVI